MSNEDNTTPALFVNKMEVFRASLSAKAKEMVDNPKAKVEEGVVSFQATALWPIKEWYEQSFAKTFNRMVEEGAVTSVAAVASVKLASGGGIYVDLRGPVECGPDHYGLMLVLFKSSLTKAELEEKYGIGHFSDQDGEIICKFPSWYHIARPQHLHEHGTLADQLVKMVSKKE